MKTKITIKTEDLTAQALIVKFLKEAQHRGWMFEFKVNADEDEYYE